MIARPTAGLALIPFAAACLLAAACSRDLSGPGDLSARSVEARMAAGETCTASDSVYAGYGCCSTGGLEYESFEYDPETGTESVATCDTTGTAPTPQPTTTTSPPPPPPPSPTPSPSTTCSDSVQAGYGSGSTGGLEYEEFEYEPATGTEYVATCDTTP